MNRPLTALVTNDDGIDSPGLHHLAQAALDAGLDVIIAAPASESSGSSASITVTEKDGRILYGRREIAALLADGCASLTALRSVAEDTALPLDDLVSRALPAR